jgi:hypothetical protein
MGARVSQHHCVTVRERDVDEHSTGKAHDQFRDSGGQSEYQGLHASKFPEKDQDRDKEHKGRHQNFYLLLPLDVFIDTLWTEPGRIA